MRWAAIEKEEVLQEFERESAVIGGFPLLLIFMIVARPMRPCLPVILSVDSGCGEIAIVINNRPDSLGNRVKAIGAES